jgi:hypothetical protein
VLSITGKLHRIADHIYKQETSPWGRNILEKPITQLVKTFFMEPEVSQEIPETKKDLLSFTRGSRYCHQT